MNHPWTLALVLIVQVFCAIFFVGQIAISVFGFSMPPISWAFYEWIEIGAAMGLTLGVILGAVLLRQSLHRVAKAEGVLADLSGAFMDLVTAHFDEWGLTPAERDVALFLLKGMSTGEVAKLRGTSEGTIKAQSNAIYRKADVGNRAQLVSLFIDDLMQGHISTSTA